MSETSLSEAQKVAEPATTQDELAHPHIESNKTIAKTHFPVKINPKGWAGLAPNGIGHQKPNHYLEMAKTIWDNRDQLPFAWRILSKGVCDGCALGVAGLSDWTMKGPHLCAVRLNLLRLNTMPALDETLLADVSQLQNLSSKKLRALGRLPYPMRRRKGEAGFTRISWDEALDIAATRIRDASPQRLAIYLTSRGLTNEVYYVAQKAARFLGTNNIDNAARICHSPSTVALKQSLGVGASTCSYTDWIGSDVIFIIGSNVANDQPVTTKYLYYAKQQGTKIVVVNTYREPGLERYWIPSAAESALFGTKITDDWFMVHTGGDLAFFNAVLKELIERGAIDQDWITSKTEGWDTVQSTLEAATWDSLIELSGASREDIKRFADIVATSKTGVFVWSMGVTQHPHGVDTVQSLINVALSQGWLGRDKCGLMPIRGHSGVQGGAEMGAYATALPGGVPIDDESRAKFSALWNFPIPPEKGLDSVHMIEAAARGELDVLHIAGGNFLETLPEPKAVRQALENVPLRIHQDIVLTSQMLVEGEEVLLFPATTRYEQAGGGTETTTERRIAYSPEIPGRRIGEARAEWQIFMELAERVYPDRASQIHFDSAQAIRDEIPSANPAYSGIERLRKSGDQVQWGGPHLCVDGVCATPDTRAHFTAVSPPELDFPIGRFRVSTRRGKQFNSIVHAKNDPLTGGNRDSVFIAASDAEALNLKAGAKVLLRNDVGQFAGIIKIAPMRPRNLQVHWPEGNVLLRRGRLDERAGVPDYNALVEIIPIADGAMPQSTLDTPHAI